MADPLASNPSLDEEIEIINAIYGPSSVVVTSTSESHTATLLRLPSFEFSFLLCFPSTYPAVKPVVGGIDMLLLSSTSNGKAALSTLRQSVDYVFRPDSNCLYELIEHFKESFEPVREYGPPSKLSTPLPMPGKHNEQVTIKPIDLSVYQQRVACTACLDDGIQVDMGKLRCGHHYCGDCLQST